MIVRRFVMLAIVAVSLSKATDSYELFLAGDRADDGGVHQLQGS